ncbi:hypothetical protein BB560_001593 [Smittium megazygosporum]|uniref:Large ribosomal subunit protein uL30m n=1 Tax=Smittium megazygosporum TaxID=133381 RepID=A0A2T9ZH39_9FUNG|nr:hypothetical protein BB560_001593 [Smittium megazygosporum]
MFIKSRFLALATSYNKGVANCFNKASVGLRWSSTQDNSTSSLPNTEQTAPKSAEEATAQSTKPDAPTKYYKIKLARSLIGLPPKTRKNAASLGLKKRGQIVFRPVTTTIAGSIFRIKELVELEITDNTYLESRSPAPGYTIVKRFQ